MTALDLFVQGLQLVFFLTGFSLITHHIVNTEFIRKRSNLQEFVLPAIISVFFWMVSISYLLLSLVLDETRKDTRLVFKDQNLDVARNMLRNSLRRRLATMDRSSGARTLQRQRDLGIDEGSTGILNSKRMTVPASTSLDLSESMRGRRVRPEDLSTVKVRSQEDSVDVALGPRVRDRVRNFEEFKMQQTNIKHARKYVSRVVEEEKDLHEPSTTDVVEQVERIAYSSGDEDEQQISNRGCWWKVKRFGHFLLESREYRDPLTYGWRIKFRRIFLTIGVLLFTYLTSYTTFSTQSFSSKAEIQKLLDYTGTNLTWPEEGSVLDDVFILYNTMQRAKSYIMIASSLLFWASLAFDFASHLTTRESRKTLYFSGSRITNFLGSLAIFAGVIIVGLPDYLEASNLDKICPFCGMNFNATVRQVAEFTIGLFFACLFTFQLIPILITIVPALVRASVLILIHPSLQIEENDVTTLRMTILQQVIQFSSMLTFPITFISMAILQQYQKDTCVTLLIIAFWTFPPFVLFLGLHYTRKFRRYTILLYVYYLYNMCYFALLIALLFYSLTLQRILKFLEDMMQEPTFWAGSIAQVFLCNVVISDMLYMTVF